MFFAVVGPMLFITAMGLDAFGWFTNDVAPVLMTWAASLPPNSLAAQGLAFHFPRCVDALLGTPQATAVATKCVQKSFAL